MSDDLRCHQPVHVDPARTLADVAAFAAGGRGLPVVVWVIVPAGDRLWERMWGVLFDLSKQLKDDQPSWAQGPQFLRADWRHRGSVFVVPESALADFVGNVADLVFLPQGLQPRTVREARKRAAIVWMEQGGQDGSCAPLDVDAVVPSFVPLDPVIHSWCGYDVVVTRGGSVTPCVVVSEGPHV